MAHVGEDLPTENETASHSAEPHSISGSHIESIRQGETASDTDRGEKATREKLKKTSINALPRYAMTESWDSDVVEPPRDTDDSDEAGHSNDEEERGRVSKKRSLDDLHADYEGHEATNTNTRYYDHGHTRKKSRDGYAENGHGRVASETTDVSDNEQGNLGNISPTKVEDKSTANYEGDSMERNDEQLIDPKKKRSRDQVDNDDDKETKSPNEPNGAPITSGEPGPDDEPAAAGPGRRAAGEPDKKRHRESSVENASQNEQDRSAPKRLSTSGLGNASAKSPFASLSTSNSIFKSSGNAKQQDQPQTSPSAFAASGFAAHSTSVQSPFGALGSSTKSGFGFGASGSSHVSVSALGGSPTPSTLNVPSPFASSSQSGFGKLGSGTLKSFASATGPGVLGSNNKPPRPFGAPAQDSEDEDEGSEGGADNEDHHTEDKSIDHKVETGEEGEETIFSCKGKLLFYDGTEWKERGLGTFKLNISEESYENHDDESEKRAARLIMRTEGVYRVILNAPVFKDMNVGNLQGNRPEGKMVYFTVIENGKPVPLILKTGNAKYTEEFYNKIQEVKEII